MFDNFQFVFALLDNFFFMMIWKMVAEKILYISTIGFFSSGFQPPYGWNSISDTCTENNYFKLCQWFDCNSNYGFGSHDKTTRLILLTLGPTEGALYDRNTTVVSSQTW